jgi:O-antigen ligase
MTFPSQSRSRPLLRLAAIAACLQDLSLWLALGLMSLSLAWLLPGRYLPWPAFRQEVLAALGFVLLAVAALVKCERVRWPRLALLALGVAAVPLVQWALGQIRFRGDAFVSSLYLAGFGVSVSVGASLARSELRKQLLDGLTLCLMLVGIASSGMALNQWLGPSVFEGIVDAMPPGGRPFANMAQPNHLATQLILGATATVYWYEQRRVAGWCAAIAIAWMGWGVVLTESRTGWMAVAVVALWWFFMRRRASLATGASQMAIGIAAFAIGIWIAPSLQAAWSGSLLLDGEAPQVRLAAGTRGTHWATLWDAMLRSPWFGYGWNQVSNAQFAAAVDHPTTQEWMTYSHNLMLDLLIFNGLPLGLLLCGALVVWFARHSSACRNAESWWILSVLLVLFAHALLEYPLHYSYYLLPAGLLMGFVGAPNGDQIGTIQARRLTLALPTIGLALLVGAIGLEYLKAEEALRDLELAARRIGPAASDLPQSDWYFVDGWAAYRRAATVTVAAGMPAVEIENLRKVAARYPYANILERYAQAAALNGQPDSARFVLLHSCKVHATAVCADMQRRWQTFRTSDPAAEKVEFPALTD